MSGHHAIRRCSLRTGSVSFLLSLGRAGPGAREKKNEEDFVKEKPAVGDALPDLTVYSPDGKEVKTSSLRGHYTSC